MARKYENIAGSTVMFLRIVLILLNIVVLVTILNIFTISLRGVYLCLSFKFYSEFNNLHIPLLNAGSLTAKSGLRCGL